MKAIHHSRVSPAPIQPVRSAGRPQGSFTELSLDGVGDRLRAAYASTLKEPLPIRLTDLLDRLGERERSRDEDD